MEERASCCEMSVHHWGCLCDRWRGWLEETEGWWWGHLFLTVACCFSAFSFASSSCFCRAAWRDFISSLSSGREVRNALLAHLPYTLEAFYYSTSEWFSKVHSFERKHIFYEKKLLHTIKILIFFVEKERKANAWFKLTLSQWFTIE